jgi:hypothetical protein
MQQIIAILISTNQRKRIIIIHAGGTHGGGSNALLLSAKNIQNCSADCHSDMDSTLFETWFQH